MWFVSQRAALAFRSWPGRPLALALLLFATLGSAVASLQSIECDPSKSECPLRFGEPVSAVLADPTDAHVWTVSVPIQGSFVVVLTDLPADYRLYAYTPDGAISGQSSNPGLTSEILEVAADLAGDYIVFVDSPLGQVSSTPYRLSAQWTGASALPVLALATSTPETALRLPPPTRAPSPMGAPVEVIVPPPPPDSPPPSEGAVEAPPLRSDDPRGAPPSGAIVAPVEATPVRPPSGVQPQLPPAQQVPLSPNRPTVAPTTCTAPPALTLERTGISADDAVVWEARGFRPGSSVRAQAFAEGTKAASGIETSAVQDDCTTGPGGEVAVTITSRAGYYLLRVTGARYGTGATVSLVARFTVSSVVR